MTLNKTIIRRYLLILILSIVTSASFSQDEVELDENGNLPDNGDPTDVPFDGGISLLVAAGIGYGVKKVRDERKKKAAEKADGLEK